VNATVGLPYSYQVVATDANPGDVLAFSLPIAPAGMAISPAGLITWAPAAAGIFPVTVQVTDPGPASATQSFAITVGVAGGNSAPTITSTAPAAGVLGQLYSYQVTATDPNAGDVINFSLTAGPAGMTISPTGLITWTPGTGQDGVQGATVRVMDQGGLFADQLFTVTVPPNGLPSFTSAPVATATMGVAYSYDANATDPDAGAVLTFSLVAAPAGMAINATTGVISWTPALAQVGANPVTARVTDQFGGFAEQGFSVNVPPNNPPSFTSTPVTAATEGSAYSYDANATDPDPGAVLAFSLVAAPAGMVIDPASGVISWTPTAGQVGANPVTVRVTDQVGASADQAFSVAVQAREVLTITSAVFRRGRRSINVVGTGTVPGNTVTVHLGDASGIAIGGAIVDAAGNWAVQARPVARGGATTVTAVSNAGTTVTFPLTIR
jgi:hypothetical protein